MNTEQSTIDKIRSRPRFKIRTAISPHLYTEQLKIFLNENNNNFEGTINTELATIWVNSKESNFWKPYLSLRAKEEDNTTIIRGVFGPNSSVWTLFMFLYFLFSILWMVFFTLWFVGKQINSTDYNWGLPASLSMLFILLLVYLASLFGQKKAKKEMELLRDFAIKSSLKFESHSNI